VVIVFPGEVGFWLTVVVVVVVVEVDGLVVI
jgi:hypothetical protein